MTSPTATSRVLSEVSLDILRTRGNDITVSNGTRKIYNTSYFPEGSLVSPTIVEIPEYLQSLETIHFMEFRGNTAETIYSDYLANRELFPGREHNVLKNAKRLVSYKYDRQGMQDSSNWVQNIFDLGLSSKFRERMMDPEYEDMRISRSLKEWVFELLDNRYGFLQTLDSVVRTPEPLILGRKSSRLGLDGKLHTKPGPDISPRPEIGHFTPQQKSIAHAIEAPPTALPEHTTLWKAGTRHRLDSLIQSDGSLCFLNLASDPPGDFSSMLSRGLYLTKHEEVAWKYAQWAAKLLNHTVVPVGFLRVAVPNQLLHSQKELFGDEWRQFVFANRGGMLKLPSSLTYVPEYQWLVGPLCHNSTVQVKAMKDPSELTLLKLQGSRGTGPQTASQHYTGQPSMFNLLDDACVGKVWITDMEGRLAEKKGN